MHIGQLAGLADWLTDRADVRTHGTNTIDEVKRRREMHWTDLLTCAQLRVGRAVDAGGIDGSLVPNFLRHLRPHGFQALAPNAPRREEVDEDQFVRPRVRLDETFERIRAQRLGVPHAAELPTFQGLHQSLVPDELVE